MAVNVNFVASGGDPYKADYYLRETQPEWERNQDLDYQMRHVPEHGGTVPEFINLKNLPDYAKEAFGLNNINDLSNQQIIGNLVSGLRADGRPTGRRIVADYTRQDGKVFHARDYYDVVLSSDISVGISLFNSATPGGRALLFSAVMEADKAAMLDFARDAGQVRLGAAGSGGTVPGHVLVVRITHHATKPTQKGFVAPNLHSHHVMPNWVVSQFKASALAMTKFQKLVQDANLRFNENQARNFHNLGIATKFSKEGAAIIAAVPEKLREYFAQRKAEIIERARDNAAGKGLDYDNLTVKQKARFNQIASMQTRGNAYDGVANPVGWRLAAARFGWSANDLPHALMALLPATLDGLGGDLVSRSDALRRGATRTWQAARQAVEANRLAARPALAVRLRAQIQTLSQHLSQTLTARAQKLAQDMQSLGAKLTQKASDISQRLRCNSPALKAALVPTLIELQKMTEKDYNQAHAFAASGIAVPNPYQENTQQFKAWEVGANNGFEDRYEHEFNKLERNLPPRQYDHTSLGEYLAVKHRLPTSLAADIAAAGYDVARRTDGDPQKRSFMESVNDITVKAEHASAMGSHTNFIELKSEKAVRDAVEFYQKINVSNTHTFVSGKSNANAPVIFVRTYGEAALMSDATKLPVVVAYTRDNTADMMARWRGIQPDRQFMVVGNPRDAQHLSRLHSRFGAAPALPPKNESGAASWLEYAKNYGTEAASNAVRQAYRQEFRQAQSQGMKQKMEAS